MFSVGSFQRQTALSSQFFLLLVPISSDTYNSSHHLPHYFKRWDLLPQVRIPTSSLRGRVKPWRDRISLQLETPPTKLSVQTLREKALPQPNLPWTFLPVTWSSMKTRDAAERVQAWELDHLELSPPLWLPLNQPCDMGQVY